MRMAISANAASLKGNVRWIPAPRQIDGAKHELLLNRLFVVVTKNRDGLKNKWSSPGLPVFSAGGRGCAVVKDVPTGGVPIAIQPRPRHTWHRTAPIKNLRGSVRTIPFGRADKPSLQPRRSSRGAYQKRAVAPTHWAASLVQYVSVHLHSRKMKSPWFHHAPKTERPAMLHHRSDFGSES
jgi:hypothetical protein